MILIREFCESRCSIKAKPRICYVTVSRKLGISSPL